MPLELRKWFQASFGLLSIVLAFVCWLIVRSSLPASAEGAQLALALLFIGATTGFFNLLRIFMPLLIVKLWPGIEA